MKISLRKLRVLAFIAFFLVNCLPVQAQEQATETTVVVPITVDKGPEDALERGNPRSSIIGYLNAASEFNWEKAAEYLDLRNLPPDIQEVGGPESMVQTSVVQPSTLQASSMQTSAVQT